MYLRFQLYCVLTCMPISYMISIKIFYLSNITYDAQLMVLGVNDIKTLPIPCSKIFSYLMIRVRPGSRAVFVVVGLMFQVFSLEIGCSDRVKNVGSRILEFTSDKINGSGFNDASIGEYLRTQASTPCTHDHDVKTRTHSVVTSWSKFWKGLANEKNAGKYDTTYYSSSICFCAWNYALCYDNC